MDTFLYTDNSYPPNVTVIPPSSDTPAKMIIPATGLYNNTVVQCLIVVIVEGEFVSELHAYIRKCYLASTR